MIRNLIHFVKIIRVLRKYHIDQFIPKKHRVVRLFFYLAGAFSQPIKQEESVGWRLKLALEELGPVFIKFGQALSTRPDLLPKYITDALIHLQDNVPPFPGEEAIALIEKNLKSKIEQHFKTFQVEAVASASVAQVHVATLKNGEKVAIKVLRPDIENAIANDIKLLKYFAYKLERFWHGSRRFKPIELVSDYEQVLYHELDLRYEAANASQLKANFNKSNLIHVPQIHWEMTYKNMVVMEYIDGIPIRNIEQLVEQGIDLKKLAHDGVEIFFTQAFRDGFFHADMHPGNIFVSKEGQYRAVDFGIMGNLSQNDKRYLAENLLAFFNRNYRAVAETHVRAGWIPITTKIEDFEASIRTVCEPIFAKPMKEISFGKFLIDLFRVARRFHMPVQPQLVLLQKTLLNLEGLGRQLYPNLNLWDTAKPFLENWMKEQIGPKSALKAFKRELPYLYTMTPEIPRLFHQVMYRVKNDQMILHTHDHALDDFQSKISQKYNSLSKRIYAALFLMIDIIVYANYPEIELGWHAVLWAMAILFLTSSFFKKT